MKRTIGRTFTAILEVYNEFKYTAENPEYKEIRIPGVEAWEVVTGERAEQIEAETDGSCIDELHEYLVLYLENGNTSTFRNSYCDLFR